MMDEQHIVKRLIPHVFLPLKLPGKQSESLISEENHLLSLLQQTLAQYEFIPQIEETCSVFKTWVDVQVHGVETRDKIRALQPGQLFALYVRGQNCGLIISIPKHNPNEIIWSTFPASQKNHVVTDSSGELHVYYPAASIEVKRRKFLHSIAFTNQLDGLMGFDFSEAKSFSIKADTKVEEIRDVNNTIFVSGWLPGLLVTQESNRSFGDIPRIRKKIRDSVVLEKALLPFRRSGMWTTAKVMLNISLVRDLGGVLGCFLYKIMVLRLLVIFLQPPVFPAMESTGIEMLKKVGRRLRKLEIFMKKNRDILKNLDLADLYDSLVVDATKIITLARKQVDQQWNEIIHIKRTNSIVALNGSNFNMKQSLIGSGLLDFLTASDSLTPNTVQVSVPVVPQRHRLSVRGKYMHNIPKPPSNSSICTDISIRLFDFERNVLHNWSDAISKEDYEFVWNAFHDYSKSALAYYSNDPVGMSRSIMTMLKMIQVWDEVVCIEHPLLESYKTGIETDFVKMLLIPSKEEIEIVDKLEEYFLSRQRAPNSCLLENEPNASSFTVKFAEQSPDMETLREVILREGQQRSEDKTSEVETATSYCESLRNKIAKMDHECGKDKIHREGSCNLCSLKEEEQYYRVTVYEKPLPEAIYRQRAVVFELLIPSEIACLRDLIYTFSQRIIASITHADNGAHEIWCTDRQLAPHTRRLLNWKVNLGSTVKHFVKTHYSQLHPTRPNGDFIVNNGYDTRYAAAAGTISFRSSSGSNIKRSCTLKVEDNSPYKLMQWAIDGNTVTPNEVLARQSECNRKLSTSEFVEFGSLRCYYKLQVRNLIGASVLGTLSFNNESVFNLICQTLWECSPRTKNSFREAHEDFADPILLQECLTIIDSVVEKHKDNWQYHYIVLMAIVFAVNVAEKSVDPAVLKAAGVLVLKCRAITDTWSEDIQIITSKMANADLAQKIQLTLKLVEVNISMAISFSAHTRIRTLATPEHIKSWLQAVTIVFDHIDFIRKNASNQMFSLVRRVMELGVTIEKYIVRLPGFHEGMNMFLRSHYGGAEDLNFCNDTVWCRYDEAEQVYFMEVKKECTDEIVTLQLDIVVGMFLVNGCKTSRLPEAIENHVDFVRVFPTMSFEVQQLGPNEAVTKHSYNGSFYSFMLNQDTLTVKEIVSGTIRRTLIPLKYLPDNFPHRFEDGFSHWWNNDDKTVEFFPRDGRQPLKIMDKKCELLLNINDGRELQHLETRRLLADTRCPTFRHVAKVLNRLESTEHIHVWFDSHDAQYTIELPRMRLSFVVHGLGTSSGIAIMSQEYEGMKIAEQQQLKTLVGLQQGLILTNDDEKLLLVPHGTVKLNDYHSITITTGTGDVFEPPYFRYDIDERIGQLKAGETQTGWFYLAYLHAVTSSFIPDPFTGVTGTERAFQILSSGICFPSQPFSAATVKIVRLLRDVAPTRTYYPNHLRVMEKVHWPLSISALAAHDNFVNVIDDLVCKSNRLEFLFDGAEVIALKERDIGLRQKAMLRRSCISNGVSGIEQLAYDAIEPPPEFFTCGTDGVKGTIHISRICHSTFAELPINTKVFDVLAIVLLNNASLIPDFNERDVCSRTMCDWMSVDFSESWLDIYQAARDVRRKDQTDEWMLFLSCLAFRQHNRISIDQLAILNAIAVHSQRFAYINPPTYDSYTITSEYEYDESQVMCILKSHVKMGLSVFAKSCDYQQRKDEKWKDFKQRMQPSFKSERDAELLALEKAIKEQWPRERIHFNISGGPEAKYSDWSLACVEINALFTQWYRNRALRSFLVQVATEVSSCANFVADTEVTELVSAMSPLPNSSLDGAVKLSCTDSPPCSTLQVRLEDFVWNNFEDENLLDTCERLFRGNFGNTSVVADSSAGVTENFPLKESSEGPIFNEFINELHNSWNQWQLEKDIVDTEATHSLLDTDCDYTSNSIWKYIYDSIKMNSEVYFLSEFCPRLAPTTLLPLICKSFESGAAMTKLITLLGGFAVTITREQQRSRIKRLQRQDNDLNSLEMKRESSNVGHTNWSPKDRPEWLLFEVENDLLIRPLQIKVAHQMECPDGGKNSLMQMNMGEGKTSVIIPLLSVSLATDTHMCRITVLKSLYQMNLKNLSLKIGGLLLNRRVYTMPCRRHYSINAKNVDKMMSAYLECFNAKGVLLTLPEHRLSFGLKKHEHALAEDDRDSVAIHDVLKWLEANVRDVLDESDEILQAKYQLLYTLGEPLTINAGSLRWTVTQKILRLVPDRIKSLLKSELSADQFEFRQANSCQEFALCRVFSDCAYRKLCAGLAEDAIATGVIPEQQPAIRGIVLKFLTQEILNESEMRTLYESISLQTHIDTLLIVRGLLACGVLRSCLSKRWRVNYGVNLTGHSKMAVPFTAKDVAAERAEFGHPDVAIVLTLLSYYYAGLSDDQLEQTFECLFKLNFAEQQYQSWIALLSPTTPRLSSIRKLSGINLRDYRQKYVVLFPAMRKNMAAIDFWLDQVVFSVESKQFGSKIGCSAWDLCRDNTTHPTTGFSGTNDTKLLLPRTIQQRDLPELLGTNGKVLENLLRPENDHYEGLERHISAENIIQKLVHGNIKVLLDVGAIMLELNNEQVADEWMKQCQSIEAVVFFDNKNQLLVKSRLSSRPTQFELSSWRNRLDRCAIYLDEVHTRGTDLKIPLGTAAVVTLGKGVRKDTLAQGCMRMRKLGQGHTIRFWGSSEVHPHILKFSENGAPGSYAVLKWALQNSVNFMEESFIHWAGSGIYELQKRSAEKICSDNESKLLAQLCSQSEMLELMSMYGLEKSVLRYPCIGRNMISQMIARLRSFLTDSHNLRENEIHQHADSLLRHLEKYAGQLERTSNVLDEEQERELQPEHENETEIELPPQATAEKHILNSRLRAFIITGNKLSFHPSDLLPLQKVLVGSNLQQHCKAATSWGNGPKFVVNATKDFERTVIQSSLQKSDDFLRPVTWIYNTVSEGLNFVILLSPFEVNKLWNEFKNAHGTLHMYRPRLFVDQRALHESGPLMVPSRPGSYDIFPKALTASLDILAGSIYFNDESDERVYCCVAGISPRPRTLEEEEMFHNGGIVNGFVDPMLRNFLPMFREMCAFQEHPERLVRGIIEARHGVFSDKSHVGNVIVNGRKNFTK